MIVRKFWLALIAFTAGACASQQSTLSAPGFQLSPGASTVTGIETETEAERLARTWIRYWNDGNPRALPLAETFVHVSPFGRLEGRDHYLDTVIPMSERNVTDLTVNRVLGRGNRAVIWFDMHTPNGRIPVCDWIVVEDGEIAEIYSFYDKSMLRYDQASSKQEEPAE